MILFTFCAVGACACVFCRMCTVCARMWSSLVGMLVVGACACSRHALCVLCICESVRERVCVYMIMYVCVCIYDYVRVSIYVRVCLCFCM